MDRINIRKLMMINILTIISVDLLLYFVGLHLYDFNPLLIIVSEVVITIIGLYYHIYLDKKRKEATSDFDDQIYYPQRERDENDKLLYRESRVSFHNRKRAELNGILLPIAWLLLTNLLLSYFFIAGFTELGFVEVGLWVLISGFFLFNVLVRYREYRKKEPLRIYEYYIHIPEIDTKISFNDIRMVVGKKTLIGDNIALIIKKKGLPDTFGPLPKEEAEKVIKILKEYGIKVEIRSFIERLKKEHPF